MDIVTMEPMVPEEASHALKDEALTLTAEANQLAGRVHPILRASIGDLVRAMNCYYSNLIEGHDTNPRDIDRALADDFVEEPKRRELRQEAVAYIHVQRLIDSGQDPVVTHRGSGERIPVVSGGLAGIRGHGWATLATRTRRSARFPNAV